MTSPEIIPLLTLSLPSLTVLVGILLNRSDVARIDASIVALGNSLRAEMATLRTEIAAVRTEANNDVLMLVGLDREQDKRITRLEEQR
jgi:hypothetical protein